MTLEEILEEERKIWGTKITVSSIMPMYLGVAFGDFCRQLREYHDGRGELADNAELKKELGNIISSTVRWCDDLGYKPEECVRLALETQRKFPK